MEPLRKRLTCSVLDCFEKKAFLLKASFQNTLFLGVIVEKGRGLQGASRGHPCRKLASQEGEEKKIKKASPTHLCFTSTKDQSNEINPAIIIITTFLGI